MSNYKLAKPTKRYTILFVNHDDQPQTVNENQYETIKRAIKDNSFIEINGILESVRNIRRIVPHQDERQVKLNPIETYQMPTQAESRAADEAREQLRKDLIKRGIIKPNKNGFNV